MFPDKQSGKNVEVSLEKNFQWAHYERKGRSFDPPTVSVDQLSNYKKNARKGRPSSHFVH